MHCYNCGKKLTRKTKTKEHIPAQSLFVGYGENYKKNRLTVPACEKCNNAYSKIDQELRDAIGVVNENDANAQELTRKSVRSILKKPNWHNRLLFNPFGKVNGVKFNYKDFKKAAIKDFKGIFYKDFGFPLSQKWKVEIIADFETDKKLVDAALGFYAYLNKDIDWSQSGHSDIFKYKLKTLTPNENGEIYDSDYIDEAVSIASIQIYHDKLGFIIVAGKRKYLKQTKGILQNARDIRKRKKKR